MILDTYKAKIQTKQAAGPRPVQPVYSSLRAGSRPLAHALVAGLRRELPPHKLERSLRARTDRDGCYLSVRPHRPGEPGRELLGSCFLFEFDGEALPGGGFDLEPGWTATERLLDWAASQDVRARRAYSGRRSPYVYLAVPDLGLDPLSPAPPDRSRAIARQLADRAGVTGYDPSLYDRGHWVRSPCARYRSIEGRQQAGWSVWWDRSVELEQLAQLSRRRPSVWLPHARWWGPPTAGPLSQTSGWTPGRGNGRSGRMHPPQIMERVLKELGFAVPGDSREVRLRCPHPDHPDRSPSATVWRELGVVHCWSPDAHGDAPRTWGPVQVAAWLRGTSYREAAQWVEQLEKPPSGGHT